MNLLDIRNVSKTYKFLNVIVTQISMYNFVLNHQMLLQKIHLVPHRKYKCYKVKSKRKNKHNTEC